MHLNILEFWLCCCGGIFDLHHANRQFVFPVDEIDVRILEVDAYLAQAILPGSLIVGNRKRHFESVKRQQF